MGVLIAAVLAGSGCYVIKKDHAESFADIQALAEKLQADNAKTVKTVDAMKAAIEKKDAIIKELQQKVTAGNEKNRLMEEKMGDLNELLESTEEKLKTDIDAKYEENMKNIKKFANEINAYSSQILNSNNRLEKTDDKLEDVIKQISDGLQAADTRQSQIDSLEKSLKDTQADTVTRTSELRQLVETKSQDKGVIEEQAGQIASVNGKIDSLNTKIAEGESKIAKLSADLVSVNANVGELKSLGAAIPALEEQVESFAASVEEISQNIPSKTMLVTLQTTATKAAEGLAAALKDIEGNTSEVRAVKAAGEKELSELAARVTSVLDDVKKGGSVVNSLSDSLESANQIIGALTSDIDGLKKKHSELSRKISAK